jgi:hypothetical protein
MQMTAEPDTGLDSHIIPVRLRPSYRMQHMADAVRGMTMGDKRYLFDHMDKDPRSETLAYFLPSMGLTLGQIVTWYVIYDSIRRRWNHRGSGRAAAAAARRRTGTRTRLRRAPGGLTALQRSPSQPHSDTPSSR